MSCSAVMQKQPSTVYVGVGSNKGDRRRHIRRALCLLQQQEGIRLEAVSPFYETRPQGGPAGQRNYWNGVVRVRTSWSSPRLLGILKRVEAQVGRRPGVRWGDREVDLDILVRGAQVLRKKDLRIPHPRMVHRVFVLRPLAELAPRLRHPVTGKSMAAHLRCLADRRDIKDKRVADFL